jgi:hypothetical protein
MRWIQFSIILLHFYHIKNTELKLITMYSIIIDILKFVLLKVLIKCIFLPCGWDDSLCSEVELSHCIQGHTLDLFSMIWLHEISADASGLRPS